MVYLSSVCEPWLRLELQKKQTQESGNDLSAGLDVYCGHITDTAKTGKQMQSSLEACLEV